MIDRKRPAFTLFEMILSIALSVTLIALIGTAINLYLTRVEASRDHVEEAQLARTILAMIAEDLRSTAIYQPQDVSSVKQLMTETASFDVDSIDAASSGSTGGTTSPGGAGGLGTAGTSVGTSGASSSGTSPTTTAPTDSTDMPLGITGSLGELYVDIVRLPAGDELFTTLTGYSNARMAMPTGGAMAAMGTTWGATAAPSNLKTVRYFVRDGDRAELTGVSATSLDPEMQMRVGGLVRQVIPRQARVFAEQTGDDGLLQAGQTLVAPEVLRIEFRFYDGQQIVDFWDMAEQQVLPRAIEVIIWLTSAKEVSEGVSGFDPQALLRNAREYRQTVFLPMAELSQMAAMAGMSGGVGSSSGSSLGSTSSSASSGLGTSSDTSGFGASGIEQ